jgi:hypothetical protein
MGGAGVALGSWLAVAALVGLGIAVAVGVADWQALIRSVVSRTILSSFQVNVCVIMGVFL